MNITELGPAVELFLVFTILMITLLLLPLIQKITDRDSDENAET